MNELLSQILDIAKQCLVKDGCLLPVGFVVRDGEVLQVMPLDKSSPNNVSLDDKGYNIFLLGAAACLLKADHVVMIWDAAFKTYPKDTDMQGLDEYERPLLYPKSMRTECIIMNSIGLPDGDDETKIVPYKGGDGIPVEWLPDYDMDDSAVTSRFTKIAQDGYKTAYKKINKEAL